MPFFSIVMPAYNEAGNIASTIKNCFNGLDQKDLEVVVTNDGSKDETLDILNKLKDQYPRLIIVNHEKNMGYGASLKDAIQAASGEFIASIDSDGQFDIRELPRLIERHENDREVVCGFRIKKQDTLFKVFSDRVFNFMVNCLFGLRLKDSNCAFKLYKRGILDNITIESRGYSAPTEILIKLKTLGYSFKEAGVNHFPREKGKSALRPFKTICEILHFLIYLRIKISLYKKGIIGRL